VFERIYSVQVDTIPIPFDQTLDRLLEYGNVNILPDVMQLTGNWPLALGERKLLTDLGPLADGITNYRQDAFPDSFVTSTDGSELYAVPFTVAPLGLWYHRESLNCAGISAPATTIDELNEHLEILQKYKPSADVFPIRVDFAGSEYSLTAFWPWIWSFGGNPLEYGEDGSVALNWTDPGTINAFQWARELIKKGYAPNTKTGWWDRARFAHGGYAYKVDGPYLRGHLSGLNPELRTVKSINDQYGVTPIPKGPGTATSVTVADDHSLAIAAAPNDPELAWTLIRFLTTNDEAIRSFHGPQGGLLPVLSQNSLRRYHKHYGDAITRTFLDEIAHTVRRLPSGRFYSQAAVTIAQTLQEVALTEGKDVRDRLAALNGELEALYAQPR
jgi:ABC-type glycerol-3-phosphate transport system substrate-binding protein